VISIENASKEGFGFICILFAVNLKILISYFPISLTYRRSAVTEVVLENTSRKGAGKITMFDHMMCKSPDVPLQDELLC